MIPWSASKPVVWDMTVICMCTDSYVEASACEAGAAAKLAAEHKMAKYSDLADGNIFCPVAFETQGPGSLERGSL